MSETRTETHLKSAEQDDIIGRLLAAAATWSDQATLRTILEDARKEIVLLRAEKARRKAENVSEIVLAVHGIEIRIARPLADLVHADQMSRAEANLAAYREACEAAAAWFDPASIEPVERKIIGAIRHALRVYTRVVNSKGQSDGNGAEEPDMPHV